MSQYTKSTNFATKDNLSPGDPLKIVRGTEIDTEFNNISTAISTKTDNSAAAITGGSITGITDLAIADGGTGASTATAALNNLLPSQTGNSSKYLQTDGTNATWDAVSLSTADITGTLPVANGGTGVTSSTGTGSVVLSNSPTLVTPALGTPTSGTLTNATGLPISTGVSGLGTGVATFLGTPSSANLASAVSDETGSGALVFANSPTLVTPTLGTPASATLTNATGLPISTGVSGLGTGIATALAVNVGSAGAPVVNGGALGTPSSGTVTNLTGTASININGTVGATTATTGAFTTVTASSTATATSFIPSSSTVPTNGLFLPAANTLGLGTNSAEKVRVTSDGYLLVGTTYGSGVNVIGTNPYLLVNRNIQAFRDTVNSTGPTVGLLKTRAALGTFGIVSNGDALGQINFAGDNGVDYSSVGAQIIAQVDGTPSSTSMPGRLVFSTTAPSTISSVERMRIDSQGNVGIGTSSPAYKLDVYGTVSLGSPTVSGSARQHFVRTGGAITADTTNGLTFKPGSGSVTDQFVRFENGGATLIGAFGNVGDRLSIWTRDTSNALNITQAGNLGIGTTAPSSKIHIFKSSGGQLLIQSDNTGTSTIDMGGTTTPARGGIRFDDNDGSLNLRTNSTIQVTLSNAGNLGLGVTPSAWGSSYKALQTPAGSISAFSTSQLGVVQNAYDTGVGTFVYVNSGFASRHLQINGQHQFYTAASGTAGNAISFTQAMTLDASGNLGLGSTSPQSQAGFGALTLNGSTGGALFLTTGNTRTAQFYNTSTAASIGSVTAIPLTFLTGDTERARIDSSGNLLVGTTSAISKVTVQGASDVRVTVNESGSSVRTDLISQTTQGLVGTQSSHPFDIMTGGTGRARFDTSGNLFVGTTGQLNGANARLTLQAGAGGINSVLANGTTSASYVSQSFTSASTSWYHLIGQSGNGTSITTNNIFIYGNGNIVNTNNSYGAISDVKLKENIVDASPKLADLMQVKVRNYNLIGDTTKQLGVVAQELETVFPAMVDESPDKDAEGNDLGTTTKSVKYSVFVPMLVKAIQELKAEFDAYKASHP